MKIWQNFTDIQYIPNTEEQTESLATTMTTPPPITLARQGKMETLWNFSLPLSHKHALSFSVSVFVSFSLYIYLSLSLSIYLSLSLNYTIFLGSF